jgi:phosphotransferase system HPr (HPr) family protein
MTEPVHSRSVILQLEQGLHLRVCSRVVAIVSGFDGVVRIHNGDKSADAASMFDLLQLVALPGAELKVEANGAGGEQVVDQLTALFAGAADY